VYKDASRQPGPRPYLSASAMHSIARSQFRIDTGREALGTVATVGACVGRRPEEVEDMGVTLRDKKPASAPVRGQTRGEPGRRRGRITWLLIAVSALLALLAGVGAVVLLHQSP